MGSDIKELKGIIELLKQGIGTLKKEIPIQNSASFEKIMDEMTAKVVRQNMFKITL